MDKISHGVSLPGKANSRQARRFYGGDTSISPPGIYASQDRGLDRLVYPMRIFYNNKNMKEELFSRRFAPPPSALILVSK
ncbi:MAG: hypothetical protein LBH70_07295, partial [Spirochaetaceae bacterium]|nr:hypothetical protein [Spirochaetaceae bacterium]